MRIEIQIDYPTWLSSDQTARYLGVSGKTLRDAANAGAIPVYRFGRVFRYRLEDVQAYVEGARWSPGKDEK